MKNPITSFSLASRSASEQWRDIGQRALRAGGVAAFTEERYLSRLALLLPELRLGERRLESLAELPPVAIEPIARAGGHQRVQHPLVAEPQIHPVYQIVERSVRAGRRTGPAPRPAMIDSIAPAPTFRTAPSPNRTR